MLKKLLLISFLALMVAGCGVKTEQITIIEPEANIDSKIQSAESKPLAIVDNTVKKVDPPVVQVEKQIEIPTKLDLEVPFVSQAPLRNWEMPYQEACEEASMMSVVKYFQGGDLDSDTVNQELLALINWEEENGYPIDLNATEISKILNLYYGIDSRLEYDVSIDRIKYELSKGNPIIIPTAGRMLGNPYFSGDGPIYHMLVIRGYDNNEFITNDVGTNTKGEKFKYKYQTIIDAIHDWSHDLAEGGMTDEEMAMGQKVMIVVSN